VPPLAAEVGRVLGEKLEDLPRVEEACREVMNAGDAAEFLSMNRPDFNKLAPSLPRHQLSEARFVYLRSELLEWLMAR
jgi:hypothetical protein